MSHPNRELIGFISGAGRLTGFISGTGRLEGTLSFGRVNVPIPSYTGEYEVTPHFEEQILLTNGKKMNDDVTVHQIPVVRTSNPYGGQTVLIG